MPLTCLPSGFLARVGWHTYCYCISCIARAVFSVYSVLPCYSPHFERQSSYSVIMTVKLEVIQVVSVCKVAYVSMKGSNFIVYSEDIFT